MKIIDAEKLADALLHGAYAHADCTNRIVMLIREMAIEGEYYDAVQCAVIAVKLQELLAYKNAESEGRLVKFDRLAAEVDRLKICESEKSVVTQIAPDLQTEHDRLAAENERLKKKLAVSQKRAMNWKRKYDRMFLGGSHYAK